jgi:hypothetical protein
MDPDWIRIRIRIGLQPQSLDPDPDPEKMNTDPKHCKKVPDPDQQHWLDVRFLGLKASPVS